MFEAGKRAEDVGNWSSNIEEPIAEADKEVLWLEKWLLETNEEIEHWKQKDDEERKACTHEEELKFEREQMEMKLEFQHHLEEAKAKQQPVEKANWSEQRTTKLPKLQITKFNGTYEAWLPFWKKFQAKIDKANLASVTKFAYLKELVDPKVRGEIDRLPFTTDGCKRTKNILICENGKMREIVNTYVQNIVNLPVITGTQPALIHEFDKREREFYIDVHWCILMHIVYDASARANVSVPSLNDYLKIGPPLQSQLWNVLIPNRFYLMVIAGDLKQAFLLVWN